MTPVNFEQANCILKAPPGWDPVEMGPCDDLHVLRQNGTVVSVWEPDADERAVLAAGGRVVLSVVGETQPPVAIWVVG